MRHVQQPLGFHVAARVIPERDESIFDVVVHREELAMPGIHRHAGDEADAGVRSHDLLSRGNGLLRRGAAGRSFVDQEALAIRVAHHHEIVGRVDGDAVEARIRVDDHPNRRQVAAVAVTPLWDRDLLGVGARIGHQAHAGFRVTGGLGRGDKHILDRRRTARRYGSKRHANGKRYCCDDTTHLVSATSAVSALYAISDAECGTAQ